MTGSGAPSPADAGGDAGASGDGTAESGERTGDGTPLRNRTAYLLALSRPRFWLYLAGPVLVGLAYGADAPADLLAPASAALVGYFLLPANVYLYGVNDVFDADVDAENPKKEDREVRFRGQRFVVAAVVLAGLGLLALFPLVDRLAWPYLAGFGLLATAYSAPPLRFKTTPFADSLSNGLYVLPGAAAYAAVAGAHPPALAFAGGWAWTMAMHTFSAIPDITPDREAGIRTTATVLGEQRTYAYCFVLWAAAAACFAAYDVRAGAVLALYPALVAGIALADVPVDRAYWWYPWINAVVGAGITLWGLAQVAPPGAWL